MPPDLVIFDCDGVLVDSERLTLRVDVEVLAGLGWPMTEEEVVERFVGRSDADMVAIIEEHLGHRLPDGWDEPYRRLHDEVIAAELTPVPGVVDALDAIDAAGVPTCVASSGTHEKLRTTLGVTGLLARFDGRIFSSVEVARGKPAPDLFLHAAARMGADPARCAVVEDSPFGLEAALAAGMRPYAYAGGLIPTRRLALPGVTLVDDLRDLPGLLLGEG
ncbi:MAG TPA: HAD family hydrolase [Acidimicrobiales bacterium]|jgi:HAD superfamily hydrolase (TIGR01509 family)